ncbi:hypothetical protein CK203_017180 [Vitis vinifera]|uniref:Reverse transcriptase zinc-binding domain-containing protein n=1 Tax=Vitis vinifera TaxID=29760 RepID=A0A438JZH2_VITVI|nr:hypothetical protein CK203_017180 [Vitis vinifera]
MGDSVGYSRTREFEGTFEDPLEPELLLCMVLKDGRSFTLSGNDGASHPEGGDEAVTLGLEIMRFPSCLISPVLQRRRRHIFISLEQEKRKRTNPLGILKEIENRRCFIKKPNESKRGMLSGSRKDRELKKLISIINYDGLAGREAEEGELGRQIVVVPYEAYRLLSWNVRGMHDPDKMMVIKFMVRKHKPDLVCCQETKVKEMSDRIIRSLGIGRNLGWVSLDARGSAGGVLVMWDKRVLEGLEVEVGSFSSSCRFRNCEEGFVCVLFGLYSPIKGRERRELWEELAAVKGLWNDPWCIAEGFNVVRFPIEMSNGRQIHLISSREGEFLRKVIVGKFGKEEGGWTTREWLIFGGDKEVVVGVGRCTLEDPSKIGNWRRSLKDENSPLFPAKEVWGSCSLCKENEESANHILIHCGKTRELWTLLLSSFGVVWVFSALVRNLLLEWKIEGLGKKRRAVWRLAPICLFWCIWGERNQRMFHEEETSDTCLRNLFFRSLLEWSQQFLDLDYLSFLNFFGDWLVG